MSYTVEKLEKSQSKLAFTIDATTFENAMEKAYQKAKGKFAIGGFRKGHAPRKVIEGLYGKGVFVEDAMDIVIPEAYSKALEEQKDLEVVARPELESFDMTEEGGATFSLIVTTKPEVELGSYKELDVKKKGVRITAAQIEQSVEEARAKQSRLVEVERPAEKGDTVTIDFSGSVDGVKFEGGTAENFDLELGSGSFIPGFEDQLVGVKAGENKDVNVKFPEDYHAEELKGKDSIFACTVHSVKTKELPTFDDEFVKEISEFDTVDAFKADLKKKLKEEGEEKSQREFEQSIIDKIVSSSKVEIPDAMLEQEVEDMIAEFEYRLSYQGLKLDQYLGYVNMSMDDLKAQYKEQALQTVKTRLIMEAIIKAEDIQFSDNDMEERIAKLAENAQKSVEDFKKTLKREQVDYIVNQIISDKLMDTLKSLNPSK